MGVYQKYRDQEGRPCGPWFVKYPYQRDRTGKIIYRVKRASNSRKLAEKFFRKKQDEFFRRDSQGLAVEGVRVRIRFSELIDWHLMQDMVRGKKSFKNDVQRAAVLKERFGDLIADEITQTMVRNFQVQRMSERTWRGEPVKPATVNREIALMKAAYNLGMDEGLVTNNPCRKVKMLKEDNARDRVLSWEEFERLREELSPAARRIVETGYYTGMRLGEILGLKAESVDLEKGLIDLIGEDTKDHERRRVYFGEELHRVLKECIELREKLGVAHGYFFIRNDGKPVRSIRAAFENACRRAGIKDFRFHDLRHTYNTVMRRAGVHDSVIMKQTGHRTMEMFLRYNTVDERDGREAVRRSQEYLRKERNECSLYAPAGQVEGGPPGNH
jgi:integrase